MDCIVGAVVLLIIGGFAVYLEWYQDNEDSQK